MTPRGVRIARVALGAVAAELVLVVITGSGSLLAPAATAPVSVRGFVWRALLAGLLLPLARVRPLALHLALLLSLTQLQLAGGRVNGDGIMYYVQLRSLLADGDLDLANEYAYFGIDQRLDLLVPTRTGLRRSVFSIGPALVWTPFYLLGGGVARMRAALGVDTDLSGFGPLHVNAVALGSLCLGFLGLFLVHATLRRHFGQGLALGATLLAWGATFMPWYLTQQPTMSHSASTFAGALAIWLWDRERARPAPRGFFLLGLALGLAACIRWQNGVLLVLPAWEALRALARREAGTRRVVATGLATLAGALLAAAPQFLAWRALFGMWVFTYPPQGTDYVRFDRPFVLETLFASRHGLLSWTPVFWLGFLGFVPLLRRRPGLAAPLLAPLLLMTYVNMCVGDWWAGASFSNRRFDSVLPLFAFGFAAALESGIAWLRRRPEAVLAALALPVVLWNALLTEVVRRNLVPRDAPLPFHRLAGQASRVAAESVGSPPTWPASWLFAWRQRRPPGQYDLLVGRYLFYRQNNLGGVVDVGAPGDEALLAEGWGPRRAHDGVSTRAIRGRARLFAPLDLAEDLELRVRLRGAEPLRSLQLRVNGRGAASLTATAEWSESVARVPAAFWRRDLNDVQLDSGDADVLVDVVVFQRVAATAAAE